MKLQPDAITLYAAIITGILTLAYPLLLQVITGLEKTYNSLSIVKLFKSTYEYIAFQVLIIAAISTVIIWSIGFAPPNVSLYGISLEYSADILVLTSTALLLFNFFLLFRRINQFYSPEKLIEFVRDHKNKKQEHLIFSVIRDLLFYAMNSGVQRREFEKSIGTLVRKLDRYYYEYKIKESEKREGVIFSDQQYSLSVDFNEYFAKNGTDGSRGVIHFSNCSSWLISGTERAKISNETYRVLWFNFISALKHDAYELIKGHWQTAVGHYTFNMKSKESISDDQNETDIYLRFHHLMCACLLYGEKYDLLKDLINYTNSSFEESPLLPKDLNGIFSLINYYGGHRIFNYEWISHYYFPGMNTIRATDEKYRWVVKFQALLFIREINDNNRRYKKKNLNIQEPDAKGDIAVLIDNIEAVEKVLPEVTSNKEVMEKFNFEPLDYKGRLNDFLNDLSRKLKKTNDGEELNKTKINIFIDTTKEKINAITNQLGAYISESDKEHYKKELFSNLFEVQVFNRDAFTKEPLTPHLDFEKVLGSLIKNKIQVALSQVLLKNTTRTYLIEENKIEKAINKLGKQNQLCIWKFNAAFDNFKTTESQISEFVTQWQSSIGKSLFIFKRSRKPLIKFIKPQNPSPDDFNFKDSDIIDYDLKLYAGVKEFNGVTGEVNKWFENKTEDEKKKSVLGIALLTMKFALHEEFEVVRILEYSELRNQGVPDDPDAVEKLK